jgi:plasmid stabilization system protein ParE
VKRYSVRFTVAAERDLARLYNYLLESERPAARKALVSIRSALRILAFSPYSCRKADPSQPRLRELLVPFGAAGYVLLIEIEPPATVTVLAVRHQREDDYY